MMDREKSSQVLAFLRRKHMPKMPTPDEPKVEIEIESGDEKEDEGDDVESLKMEIARLKAMLGEK
jgi:hypothetical protein